VNENTAIVSKKLVDKAKEHQKLIVHLWSSFRCKPMALGIAIAQARKHNVWSILNFESENAWRENLDIGRSTWFRSGGIAEKLMKAGVPEKELLKWSLDNGEIMLDLSAKQLKQTGWWKLAREKKACELAELVEKALPAGKDGDKSEPEVERRVSLNVHLYDSQRTVILEGVKEFNREHGIALDDIGRGLELIVAEVKGNRRSVVDAIRRIVVPQMQKFLKEAKANGHSVEEQLDLAFDVIKKSMEGLVAVVQ